MQSRNIYSAKDFINQMKSHRIGKNIHKSYTKGFLFRIYKVLSTLNSSKQVNQKICKGDEQKLSLKRTADGK